jgi:hypothetical protein
MTSPHDSGAHPRSEDDRVDSRTVVLVGVGALVLFALASLAAGAYLQHRMATVPTAALPAELGQSKIGLVEQAPFSDGIPLRGERDRAVRQARLERWGWVDRAHGVAHIPIGEAMALVVAGVRVARGEPPVAPPFGAARGGVDAPSVPIGPPLAAPAAGQPGDRSLPRKGGRP